MLIVNRKVGERIVIGGGIEIIVNEVSARKVRLGIVAPRGVTVLRGEVHDDVAAANRSALDSLSTAAPELETKEEARE